jgi:hypothetical protein
MAELRGELAAAQRETEPAAQIQRAVARFDPLWDLFFVPERFRITHLLIESVVYDGATGAGAGFLSARHHQPTRLASPRARSCWGWLRAFKRRFIPATCDSEAAGSHRARPAEVLRTVVWSEQRERWAAIRAVQSRLALFGIIWRVPVQRSPAIRISVSSMRSVEAVTLEAESGIG